MIWIFLVAYVTGLAIVYRKIAQEMRGIAEAKALHHPFSPKEWLPVLASQLVGTAVVGFWPFAVGALQGEVSAQKIVGVVVFTIFCSWLYNYFAGLLLLFTLQVPGLKWKGR